MRRLTNVGTSSIPLTVLVTFTKCFLAHSTVRGTVNHLRQFKGPFPVQQPTQFGRELRLHNRPLRPLFTIPLFVLYCSFSDSAMISKPPSLIVFHIVVSFLFAHNHSLSCLMNALSYAALNTLQHNLGGRLVNANMGAITSWFPSQTITYAALLFLLIYSDFFLSQLLRGFSSGVIWGRCA